MKTRAQELYDAIEKIFWTNKEGWCATFEAHLAAAYEQGRADERIAQNPPSVAQPWRVSTTVKMSNIKWYATPLPPTIIEPKAAPGFWIEDVLKDAEESTPDPRLKSLTEEQLSQLGRALARK